MRKYLRFFVFLPFCFFLLSTIGCLDVDQYNVRYYIDSGLKGRLTLEFQGIHSTETKLEDQKKEMSDFYEKGYLEDVSNFEKEWSLKNVEAVLTNKTETKCDGREMGDFDDLVVALLPLVEQADFEIKREKNRFSFRVVPESDKEFSTFSVEYTGKIVENNASKYEEQAHLMEWNLSQLDPSGIHFVLELENTSNPQTTVH